jgi:SNF2 family DNA or RNA helicase
MHLTDYHAKYFAHELTKRCASDSLEKLAGALVAAQVDLNPHQVEAALFAFKSPLSKGAIFADEVGLGKTIEAGLVISQKWAECIRRRPESGNACGHSCGSTTMTNGLGRCLIDGCG